MWIKEAFDSCAVFAIKAMWAALIFVPSIWVLIGALREFGVDVSKDIPSWVQAVGSIAAIFGAFAIGNIQHQREVKKAAENAEALKSKKKRVLLRHAQETMWELSILREALTKSLSDYGNPSLNEFEHQGHHFRFHHILHSLNAMNVEEIDGVQSFLLLDLKTGCSFALEVCSNLKNWNSMGDTERIVIGQVGFHLTRAEQFFNMLSGQKKPS